MGMKLKHTCDKCGYQAVVSGGADSGVKILTDTFKCLDCHEIFDTVIGERENTNMTWTQQNNDVKNFDDMSKPYIKHHPNVEPPIHCTICNGINAELWDGYCPKCGSIMSAGENIIVMWD